MPLVLHQCAPACGQRLKSVEIAVETELRMSSSCVVWVPGDDDDDLFGSRFAYDADSWLATICWTEDS